MVGILSAAIRDVEAKKLSLEIDDGKPAIPDSGMSLRDWFAGMALQGIAKEFLDPANTAKVAFAFADAMLTERSKRQEVA